MRVIIALTALAIALPCAAYTDAKAQTPSRFFVNEWGGLNYCANATRADDKAFCAGTYRDARRDPDEWGFNCSRAEVDAEREFCGKPVSTSR